MHLIKTELSATEEREFIHAWTFYLKSASINLGGIITAHDTRKSNVRYLQSLATGERKYVRLCETEEELRTIYAWAAEEIICAYRAKVDVLVFDYLGPEITCNQGLAPALKAVEYEHSLSNKERITKLIMFSESSVFHSSFFHQLNNSSLKRHSSLKEFLVSKVATESMPRIVELSQAISTQRKTLIRTYSQDTCVSVEDSQAHSILRLPVLVGVLGVVFTELSAYVAIRQLVNLIERVMQQPEIKTYNRKMSRATAYSTWSRLARELDIIDRRGSSQINPALASFSMKFLDLATLEYLSPADVDDLLAALADCSSSISTLITENNYSSNYLGCNVNLSMFVDHYTTALRRLVEVNQPLVHNFDMDIRERRFKSGLSQTVIEVDVDHKQAFIHELSRRFGSSALLLSGGASNAYHHLGVAKCLLEHNLLPRHLSGASGGALIGSLLCTHTDEELRALLNDRKKLSQIFDPCAGGWTQMAKNYYKLGTLFDVNTWIDKLKKKVCGELTFIEAYEKTGRSLTITVYNVDDDKNHTRCLNYKTTPDIVIYSAVLASSALPKLLPATVSNAELNSYFSYHALDKGIATEG